MSYEDRISIATPEGVDLEITLAGVGSRCVARLIDQSIQAAIFLAVFLLLAALGSTVAPNPEDETTGAAGAAVAVVVVFLFLLQMGYDVLFETLASGRTPGKRATGLRVVRGNGAPVGFVASAVRNLLRLVDFLPGMYGVGIVAILASSRNQRVGDMAGDTLVVRERKLAPAVTAWTPAVPPPYHWDVSAVTAEEVATIRRFLDRRASLTPDARYRLSVDLANRLWPKVAGAPGDLHPEHFLEQVLAAKSSRL
ncbi:MAG TPA: RDD family protein [Acidimicrobiales bacterium]|nr:RDD family protein [Acidimicrobiales bacterium]